MENDNNSYTEECQYYGNDNGSVGGVIDDNLTCEPVTISDNRSYNSNSNNSSSSSKRPSKKRIISHSFVWKHFERMKDSNGCEFVICKAKKIVNNNETECNNKTKYYGSTSNMKLHLLSEHDISESGKLKVNIN
jgi:hypothetical protein